MISFEELKTWTDGKNVLEVFNLSLNDLVSELGIEEKKTN